jgi:hypothetical protein
MVKSKAAMTESERIWSAFESSVFDTGAVMRGADVGAKMDAVSHLQSLAEEHTASAEERG